MKNKILYIIASVMLTGFTSCSDFLDRYPTEELSDGSFWKTKTDAEMAVSDIYRCLPNWDIDEDINSDNAVHGIKWANGNVSKGVYDPADQGWSEDYGYIRRCNLVLQKLEEMELSQSDKEPIAGQAYFFRGYIYFELIRKFGDVPYHQAVCQAAAAGEDGVRPDPRS